MSISEHLMTAILAFDAYNHRDYAQMIGIGDQIGTATRLQPTLPDGSDAAGFSAEAYSWNGTTVISYRGTDEFGTDVLSGYGIGAGYAHNYPFSQQGQLALEFFRSVFQLGPSNDPRNTNVLLTGHSLGAGLAGYVASLYQRTAIIFDNMPFQLAANNAYTASTTWAPIQSLRESIYGSLEPWNTNSDYIVNVYIPNAGVVTNLLAAVRSIPGFLGFGQTISEVALDLPSDTPLGWTKDNMVGQRHDGSLIVIRSFADESGDATWEAAAKYFLPSLFNKEIGGAVGAASVLGERNDVGGAMRGAIAYSAIDEGTMPFGDSGIRALYNDARAFGHLLDIGTGNPLLEDDGVGLGIGQIIVQFAGDVALQKSEADLDKNGVVSVCAEHKLIFVDLDPEKWASTFGSSGQEKIVGAETLIDSLIENAGVPKDQWLGDTKEITRIVIGTGSESIAVDATQEAAPNAYNGNPGGMFLIGSTGNDTFRGGDGEDILAGGDGNDLLRGGDRDDLLIGGEGDDTLIAESESNQSDTGDMLIGGAGADRFIIGSMTGSGDKQIEFTIADADADDRLYTLFDFFTSTVPVLEGSELFPILGGFRDAMLYNGEIYSYFEWRTQSQGWGNLDQSEGVYDFEGQVLFNMEGADLLIHVFSGHMQAVTKPFDDAGHTISYQELIIETGTETIIRVTDFTEGDLGIHFYDPGTPTEMEVASPWNPVTGITPVISYSNYDAGVQAMTNGGQLDPALGAFPNAPKLENCAEQNGENSGGGNDSTPPAPPSPPFDPVAPNRIEGTSSDDTIYLGDLPLGNPDVTVDGLSGNDTVNFSSSTGAVDASLGEGVPGTASNGYFLVDVENITGSYFDDTLTGGAGSNKIWGRAGDDAILGLAGNDALKGESGDDTLTGGAGDDIIDGGEGNDVAVFSGDRADYEVRRLTGGGVLVRDLRASSPDGTDDVRGIETFQFADGTLSEFAVANHGPVGSASSFGAAERDTAATFASSSLLAGTTDLDGDTLTITAVSGAQNGTVSLDANGDVIFTPGAGFSGVASFTYTVSDGNGGTIVATKTLLVAAPAGQNNAPDILGPFALTVQEDTPVTQTIPGVDFDGDTISYSVKAGTEPVKGTVTFGANGTFTYTPNQNANGTDTFTLVASDGNGGTAEEVVTVTIASVNDGPVAVADTAAIDEDAWQATINVLANDADADGNTLRVLSGTALHGTIYTSGGNIKYTPDANYHGADTITYQISDQHGGYANATVDVTVASVNDGPVAVADAGLTVGRATPLTISAATLLGNDTDADGDSLSIAAVGYAQNGTVSIDQNGDIQFVASTPGFSGTATFEYDVSDGNGGWATGTASIDVQAVAGQTYAGTSANQTFGGTADDDTYTVSGDSGLDTIAGGFGYDAVSGGSGNDYIRVAADFSNLSGVEVIDGGAGTDRLVVGGTSNAAVTLDLRMIGVALANIEFVVTNGGNDTIDGTESADHIDAGQGTNTVYGHGGDDEFILSSANGIYYSVFDGGGGIDRIKASTLSTASTLAVLSGLTNLISIEAIDGRSGSNDSITGTDGDDVLDFSNMTLSSIEMIGGGLGNDTITGSSGNDTISGAAGNDVINGGDGDDVILIGSDAGTDTIDGGVGTNIIRGAGSNDIIRVTSGLANLINISGIDGATGTQTVLGTSGNDTLNFASYTLTGIEKIDGGAGNDNIVGSAGNDVIDDQNGSNVFDGGAGADTMIGGSGADVFYVDNLGDVVTDYAGGGGVDTVNSSVTFTLSAGLDNLVLTGSASIGGTGNSFNNTITGNSGDNTLSGGTGNDTLVGGLGNDTYIIDGAEDVITEAAGAGIDTVQSSISTTLGDNVENLALSGSSAINGHGNGLDNVLTGNSGNNSLAGWAGNDTLDGGAGIDTLSGGAGNDVFIVDTTTDVIGENGGEGTDLVLSSVTFSIANSANVENVTLTGSSDTNATGNSGANLLTGNAGNNTLSGLSGNDTLDGGAGNDTLVGGSGSDTYVIDSLSDVITENGNEGTDVVKTALSAFSIATISNVENLTGTAATGQALTGSDVANAITGGTGDDTIGGAGGVDTLYGGAGNDVLDGGTGNDYFYGGAGSDTFIVDSATDTIFEYANEGADTVLSSLTFSISSLGNVENLTLTGSAASAATGNSAANTLIGNAGDNTLNGRSGTDILTGGAGADTFVFNTALMASNVDTVTDYSVEDDTFNLENTGTGLFTAFTVTGAISAAEFGIGTSAQTASERIIYNSTTGELFYDADGTGATAQIKFAVVQAGLALNNNEFFVI